MGRGEPSLGPPLATTSSKILKSRDSQWNLRLKRELKKLPHQQQLVGGAELGEERDVGLVHLGFHIVVVAQHPGGPVDDPAFFDEVVG